MVHVTDTRPADTDSEAPVSDEQFARRQAIRQIERRHRFWISSAAGTAAMIIVAVIWAIAEYHNAGGWPSQGFSQSSGIHDVWNIWIIYPFIGWVLLTATHALVVFVRRPVSEKQIRHEMERQAGRER